MNYNKKRKIMEQLIVEALEKPNLVEVEKIKKRGLIGLLEPVRNRYTLHIPLKIPLVESRFLDKYVMSSAAVADIEISPRVKIDYHDFEFVKVQSSTVFEHQEFIPLYKKMNHAQ